MSGYRGLPRAGHNLVSRRGCECPKDVTYRGSHKDGERENLGKTGWRRKIHIGGGGESRAKARNGKGHEKCHI